MKKPPSLSDQATRPSRPTAPAAHVIAAHDAVHGVKLSRLSIDIPEELHRRVKAKAAGEGRALREAVIELLNGYAQKS